MFDNDYDYTKLNHNGKLYKKALEIDGKYGNAKNNKIDGNEKSIFFKWAKKYAKDGDTEANSLFGDSNSVFGIAYSDNATYTPTRSSGSSGSSGSTITPEISEDMPKGTAVNNAFKDIKLSDEEKLELQYRGKKNAEKVNKASIWTYAELAEKNYNIREGNTHLETASFINNLKNDDKTKQMFVDTLTKNQNKDYVKIVAKKTIEMCDALNKNGYNANKYYDEGYTTIKSLADDKNEDTFDSDDIEIAYDYVRKISKMFIEKFGVIAQNNNG